MRAHTRTRTNRHALLSSCPTALTKQPTYLPGPERIPKTNGRSKVYLNNANMGDIGAKLVAAELKDNKDCTSLWLYGNGITHLGAIELAKGLKTNSTLTVLDLHDNRIG